MSSTVGIEMSDRKVKNAHQFEVGASEGHIGLLANDFDRKNLGNFRREINTKHQIVTSDLRKLHEFSVTGFRNPKTFAINPDLINGKSALWIFLDMDGNVAFY